MKNHSKTKSTFFLLAIATIFLVFSCSKDDEAAKANFIGTYDVTETCDDSNNSYVISITAVGTDGNSIQIYNLWDWEEYATATVSGSTISIPNQILDAVTFSGSGTLSDKTLTLNYTAIDDDGIENCRAICVKK